VASAGPPRRLVHAEAGADDDLRVGAVGARDDDRAAVGELAREGEQAPVRRPGRARLSLGRDREDARARAVGVRDDDVALQVHVREVLAVGAP
jgi:hypothetical protein